MDVIQPTQPYATSPCSQINKKKAIKVQFIAVTGRRKKWSKANHEGKSKSHQEWTNAA